MSYVITKKQLLRFRELSDSAARLAVKHFSGSLDKLSESAKDILIDSGLFALRGGRLVSLVRTYSAVGGGASLVQPRPQRKSCDPLKSTVALFRKLYKVKYRQRYVTTKADLAQLRRLAKELAVEDIEARMVQYFKSDCRHPATIKAFASCINRLSAVPSFPAEEDDTW